MTRDEYRRRIAELRPLIAAFRGPLEHNGHGGSNGSISERTPTGTEYHVGGAVTEEAARAIVAAVNFVRDLCRREEKQPTAQAAPSPSAVSDDAERK